MCVCVCGEGGGVGEDGGEGGGAMFNSDIILHPNKLVA